MKKFSMNSTSHTGDYLEKLQLTLKAISNFLGDRFKIHIKSKSPDQLHRVAHLCWEPMVLDRKIAFVHL